MLRHLFLHRVRSRAHQLFAFLFPQGFDGEVFICGGAFKPLLRKGLAMHDLDLWVRDRKQRAKLCQALLDRGAVLLQDFHPYCLKFRLEGQIIEITYHNVKDGTLADVLHTFDIALCAMGARFHRGRLEEVYVTDECWNSIRAREVRLLDSYFCFIGLERPASLLRSLHRMGQKAAELNYQVNSDHEHRLWEIYWKDYTEEERRTAMDLYFDTMVAYKGQHDERIVHRASVSYVPIPKAQGDALPLPIAPRGGLRAQPA
jgi:hypothetical protein